MIVNTEKFYSFQQAAEVLGVTTQRLFELTASPYVEKVHRDNRIYFSKESLRKLVLGGIE